MLTSLADRMIKQSPYYLRISPDVIDFYHTISKREFVICRCGKHSTYKFTRSICNCCAIKRPENVHFIPHDGIFERQPAGPSSDIGWYLSERLCSNIKLYQSIDVDTSEIIKQDLRCREMLTDSYGKINTNYVFKIKLSGAVYGNDYQYVPIDSFKVNNLEHEYVYLPVLQDALDEFNKIKKNLSDECDPNIVINQYNCTFITRIHPALNFYFDNLIYWNTPLLTNYSIDEISVIPADDKIKMSRFYELMSSYDQAHVNSWHIDSTDF